MSADPKDMSLADPEIISIPESEDNTNFENVLIFDNIENTTNQRGVTFHKSVLCKKRNCKYFKYETDAKQRERVKTNLLSQLERVVQEYKESVQGDAVVIALSSEFESNYRIVGTQRLKTVAEEFITDIQKNIITAMETNEYPDDPLEHNPLSNLFPLPPLRVNETPITLDKMSQAHLRAFIPLMLKYSLGRGKPGWGKMQLRPVWWPKDVPWANIRTDSRTPEEKAKISWSYTLRKIVKCCYEYHGRLDLIGDTKFLDPFQLEGKTNAANLSGADLSEEMGTNIALMTSDGLVTLYCTNDNNKENDAGNGSAEQ